MSDKNKGESERGGVSELSATDRVLILDGDVNYVESSGLGKTPLMYACGRRDVHMVEALLAAPGIDVNRQDAFGLTAAYYACGGLQQDEPRVAELLASHGVDMTYCAFSNRTPLYTAATWGNPRIASFLLSLPEVCDALTARDRRNGETAEEAARKCGNTVIADMIAAVERQHKAWKDRWPFLAAVVSRSRMQVQLGVATKRIKTKGTAEDEEEEETGLRAALLDGRLVRHGGMKYMSRLGGKVALFM